MRRSALFTALFFATCSVACAGSGGASTSDEGALQPTATVSSATEASTTLPSQPTATVPSATETTEELRSRLDAIVEDPDNLRGCGGILTVAEEGEALYTVVVGSDQYFGDTAASKITPTTRFLIGSVTKQFTAMLIMQLVEQGEVDLTSPISEYLPEYPAPAGDSVTIHNLLSQTSGLPNYTSLPGFRIEEEGEVSPEELVLRFSSLPLNFPPGSSFEYSNSNYAVLGLIIERVTGESFAEVLQQNILAPAGMEDTGYDPRAFETAEIGPSFHGTYGANLSVAHAAGGMYSTAKDLVLWDRALSRNLLLSQSYQDQIFTPYTKSLSFAYGYGWVIESIRGEPVYLHGGGILGFRSYIVRRPESDQVVVFLCNVEGGNPSGLPNMIVRALQ